MVGVVLSTQRRHCHLNTTWVLHILRWRRGISSCRKCVQPVSDLKHIRVVIWVFNRKFDFQMAGLKWLVRGQSIIYIQHDQVKLQWIHFITQKMIQIAISKPSSVDYIFEHWVKMTSIGENVTKNCFWFYYQQHVSKSSEVLWVIPLCECCDDIITLPIKGLEARPPTRPHKHPCCSHHIHIE